MQANIQTDDIDARIISALGADGRRSYADVGAEVGLSTAAVHERVKKMLDKGVIRRFSISVDPERVGLNFTAFVAIRNDGGIHCRDVAPRLRAMPQVEELHSVFDPRGGYFKKGGKFCPSLVSEIGDVIETHLKRIGLIEDEGLDEHQKKLIAEKRAQYESKLGQSNAVEPADNGQFPEGAKLCTKCNTKAMIIMDNCLTCLNCGDSKCG